MFARAAKYSLFDPAKEMVYIEMDADEKKQGKAAVDLVGSQVRGCCVQGHMCEGVYWWQRCKEEHQRGVVAQGVAFGTKGSEASAGAAGV